MFWKHICIHTLKGSFPKIIILRDVEGIEDSKDSTTEILGIRGFMLEETTKCLKHNDKIAS